MKRACWFGVAAWCLALFVAPAGAVVIDDFEAGPFSLSQPGTNVGTQPGPASSIVGTEREVSLNAGSAVNASVTASLELTSGDDATIIAFNNTGGGGGALTGFYYDGVGQPGLNDVDLTEGGQHDRILVTLTRADGAGPMDSMIIQASDMAFNNSERVHDITGPGVYEFLYSDFTGSGSAADFAHARYIVFGINNGVGTYVLSDIRTAGPPVPEPAGLGLIGLAMMLTRRKRGCDGPRLKQGGFGGMEG
jgi:hypothetical protein